MHQLQRAGAPFLYGSGLVSSPIAGRLVDRVEPRLLSIAAMLASLAGTLLFLTIDAGTPLSAIVHAAHLPRYAGWAMYEPVHGRNVQQRYLALERATLAE